MSAFQCTACGSPLSLTSAAPTITCPACGTGVLVPAEVRAAFADMAAAQAAAEAAARAAPPAPEPAPIPAPKPEPKAEEKPHPKPEPKPEGKADVKPAAKPAQNPAQAAAAMAATTAAAPKPAMGKAGRPSDKAPTKKAAAPADEVYLEDDFTDADTGWAEGDQGDGIETSYTEDGYQLFIGEAGFWWESYAELDVDDVSVEVEVTRFKGPKDGSFGLIARVTDDGAYSFQIDGAGYYGIYKYYYDEDTDTETLAEGEHEGVVKTEKGASNRLKAVCVGQHLTFYVNGRAVLEAADDEFASGDVGLIADTEESDRGGLDVRYRSLVVRAP